MTFLEVMVCTADRSSVEKGTWYTLGMSKLIDDAVRVLRDLPEAVQQAAARAILDYGAGYDDDVHLSDAHVAEVERRMADPNRTFLSLDDVRNRLHPFGI